MSRFHSYITSASKIISTYSAGKPLALHIRSFFASDKKYGSRDRRQIASLCYYYFRTGRAFKSNSIEKKILFGSFLCENKNSELLHALGPEFNERIELPAADKISFLKINDDAIFPFGNELGESIDQHLFTLSFLKQPRLFLRIRPGRNKIVLDKLNSASVNFQLITDDCLQLENNVSADKILYINKDVVIQDLNSQKVFNYLERPGVVLPSMKKITSWDCCAASGGKSILLFDKLKAAIQLTVSDIRDNILANLSKRLQQAGININRSFLTDLSVASGLPLAEKFSIIVCDVPCTGSGTWSRNPEQLFFFKKEMIDDYVARQQQIVSNTIPHLNEDGLFFYITCSVFKKENENIVSFIKEKFHLQLMQMEYLKGYENFADTMFVAVFSKTIS